MTASSRAESVLKRDAFENFACCLATQAQYGARIVPGGMGAEHHERSMARWYISFEALAAIGELR